MTTISRCEAAAEIIHRCVERCGLCHRLIGLARLRVAQIHRCDARIDAHFLSLIGVGLPVEKLALVADWREAGGALQPREQAVLSWAEALAARDSRAVADTLYQKNLALLGHKALVGLSLAIALENALSQSRFNTSLPSFATLPPEKNRP